MTAVETNNLENLAHKLNGSQSISMVEDAKYLPIFPKATRLLFNSGNVVSSDRLKKRTNLNPEEEVNHFLLFLQSCLILYFFFLSKLVT